MLSKNFHCLCANGKRERSIYFLYFLFSSSIIPTDAKYFGFNRTTNFKLPFVQLLANTVEINSLKMVLWIFCKLLFHIHILVEMEITWTKSIWYLWKVNKTHTYRHTWYFCIGPLDCLSMTTWNVTWLPSSTGSNLGYWCFLKMHVFAVGASKLAS